MPTITFAARGTATPRRLLSLGALAGAVGGAAEVAWVGLFSAVAGGSASEVAIGVTATVAPGLATTPAAAALGLAIHFALAIALGLAIAVALRVVLPQLAGTVREAGLVVALLAAVWAINFFVVLPVLNPDFVALVPLPASFASKLLFGVAAALVLRMGTDRIRS